MSSTGARSRTSDNTLVGARVSPLPVAVAALLIAIIATAAGVALLSRGPQAGPSTAAGEQSATDAGLTPATPATPRVSTSKPTSAAQAIPRQFAGAWFVDGGSLVINVDGTARSRRQGTCPVTWSSPGSCHDVFEFDVEPEGDGLRLTVVDTYLEGDSGKRGVADYFLPSSRGSFYLMTLAHHGAARTLLTNDDGVVAGANGLGNPYLCRPESRAARRGVCG